MVYGAAAVRSDFALDLLTPTFDPSHHGVYLALLRDALRQEATRNIALTGAYGTGKSSVLEELRRDPGEGVHPLAISLSSLGLDDISTSEGAGPEVARTNQIQKEIVKQILYTVHPSQAPRSRFSRVSRGRNRDGLPVAALTGLVVAIAVTWGRSVVDTVMRGTAYPALTFVVSFTVACGFAYLIRRVVRGRVSIEQINAGPASISLSATSTTFFDEYLDEIVYCFEVTRTNVVIFEDIDRFDNAGIFETLRALNTLLNSAPQLVRGPVRFIYAMRDSVFQRLERQLGPEELPDGTVAGGPGRSDVDEERDDVERANRTKFFDLVIPVVPFITRENARDIMAATFRQDAPEISDRLLNIVARYIADMRLVTNIRNEYKVFRHHLIYGRHAVPGLDGDHLLAIVVYKNVHLGDFERIRLGTSNLDALYEHGRAVIKSRVEGAMTRLVAMRAAIENQDWLDQRAAVLGQRLASALSAIDAQIYRFDGRAVEPSNSPDFWRGVVSGAPYRVQFPGGSVEPASPKLLGMFVGEPLTPDRWDTETRPALERDAAQLEREVRTARGATWAHLYAMPSRAGTAKPPADAKKSNEPALVAFADATRRLLRSDLAADLVEHGYLDEYFSLYIAPFYGEQISRRARTFIQQHVDRNTPDELYVLDGGDVDAVLRDRPHALEDIGIYNVTVMDHLLRVDRAAASQIVSTIPRMGVEQVKLLQAYVEHGTRTETFVELLTPAWPPIFAYLAEDAHVDFQRLLPMVDAALRTWADGTEYPTPDSVRALIEEHHAQLSSLSGPRSSARAAELAVRAGVLFADLDHVGEVALPTIRDAHAYAVSAPNLRRVTGVSELTLDAILACDAPAVFDHVRANLRKYLAETPGQPTVRDPARFVDVLGLLADQNPELVDRVVEGASSNCEVSDLADVPQSTWEPLARHGKFCPTVENLHAYILARGVDGPLASLLELAGPVVGSNNTALAAAVRVSLVNARTSISDPQRRVELATQVTVDAPIEPADLPREATNIVALLLRSRLVEDAPSTFAAGVFVDGSSFADAAAASERFATFMTPSLIPVDWLGDVMAHPGVEGAVKDAVLDNLDAYTSSAPEAAFRAIAAYAVGVRARLTASQIATLHGGGVGDRTVIALVARSDVTGDVLVELVARLGKYEELSRRGTPKVELTDEDDHRDLVVRLTEAGIVSSHSSDGHVITVWRRRV